MAVSERELRSFGEEVASWIKHHQPRDPDFLLPQSFLEVGTEQQLDFLREWQYKVYTAGYLGLCWPKAYGGYGLDAAFQKVADREMAKARTPIIVNAIGLNWAGPLVLDFGTDADKKRFLPGILSGDDIWCQGFSEPDHGSDLGSIQTRAEREGDYYRINGSKIWTTLGNFARYMILLARTQPAGERKYQGLSFFLAPLEQTGVQAVPIRKITGEYGFNQMFFDDVLIPADSLIGGEGNGWQMAMRTLEYERGVRPGAAGGLMITRTTVADLLTTLQSSEEGRVLLQEPVVRDQLVRFLIEEKALAVGQKRQSISALNTDFPGALALSAKLRSSEFDRRLRQFAVTHLGLSGALYVDDPEACEGGFWTRAYMNNFSTTIGGGTSEVLRNVVGEHVLGLPK